MRPALRTLGRVNPTRLPAPTGTVRPGTAADLDLAAEISTELRGAAHTAEIGFAMRRGARLLVCEDRGYAVAQAGYGTWLLAARDETAATELLWRALEAGGDAERPVRWITGGQDWAVRVVLGAGLQPDRARSDLRAWRSRPTGSVSAQRGLRLTCRSPSCRSPRGVRLGG